MDREEYKIRTDEIQALMSASRFPEAVKLADSIDWKRVKSVKMLCKVGDLYKVSKKFQKSRNIMLLAYDRDPYNEKIVYSLCELSIRLGQFVGAIEYLKEYIRLAPGNPGRYVLQYKIYEEQGVNLEERAQLLEELKTQDYKPRWVYELACLYRDMGDGVHMIAQCDEIFDYLSTRQDAASHRYVVKALELKSMYAPLTQVQEGYLNSARAALGMQEPAPQPQPDPMQAQAGYLAPGQAYAGYDISMHPYAGGETRMYDAQEAAAIAQAGYVTDETRMYAAQEAAAIAQTPYVTDETRMFEAPPAHAYAPPQPAIQITQGAGYAQPLPVTDDTRVYSPVMPQGAGFGNVEVKAPDVSNRFNTMNLQEELAKNVQAAIPGEEASAVSEERRERHRERELRRERRDGKRKGRKGERKTERRRPEETTAHRGVVVRPEAGYAVRGPRTEEDPYAAPVTETAMETPVTAVPAQPEPAAPTPAQVPPAAPAQAATVPPVQAATAPPVQAEPPARDEDGRYDAFLSQEGDGQISMVMPDENPVEEQITGQISIEDIMNRIRREAQAVQEERVQQIVKGRTEGMFNSFERTAKEGPQAELDEMLGLGDHAGNRAPGVVRPAVSSVIRPARPVHIPDEAPATAPAAGEADDDGEEEESFPTATNALEALMLHRMREEQKEAERAAKAAEKPAYLRDGDAEEAAAKEEAVSEETPEDEEDATAEAIETESEAEASAEAIEQEAKTEEKTEAAGAEDEEKPLTDEEIASRIEGMSDAEKSLYGHFLHNRKVARQIVEATDILAARRRGGAIVIGKDNDTSLNIAKGLIRTATMEYRSFSGKVAKIKGDSLSAAKMPEIFGQLRHGALIITGAARMGKEAKGALIEAMKEHARFTMVLMIDTDKNIRDLLNRDADLATLFRVQVDAENAGDEALVAFGREYAREKEYSIDNLGVLALHTRIEERQTFEHQVTLDEVKEIIDDAIANSERRNFGHFIDVLARKRYDEEDMVILREKDFLTD
ncbi:MAG: hypothetical protein IJQ21_07820 [Lachnospiraceae bacterium]|nr:hypothetical protein [Lachnospiraceae bacterium]